MSHQPSNAEIAHQLDRLSQLMDIAGENPFRIRAIRVGAESVGASPVRIADIANDDAALRAVPGIGAGIAALIQEYVSTRKIDAFESLQNRAPEGLIDVVSIPGIGGKTAKKLFDLAGVRDLESLGIALEDGTIARTTGLGPKLADRLAAGIASVYRRTGRHRIGDARPIGLAIARMLAGRLGGNARVELTGSLRRWQETVGNIDLIATGTIDELSSAITGLDGIGDVSIDGNRLLGMHPLGFKFALHAAQHSDFGSRWLETTGPAAHIGLLSSESIEAAADEAEIYARFGLPWIAPEFRQGATELDLARSGQLDEVISLADVQGELHSHTVWSDGVGTIEEMADSARGRGYRYLGISDHSHSLGVANGLDSRRLLAQGEAIREASANLGFPLYRSSEVEVLKDGALDFDDATLRGLDVVIASTHTGLTRPRPELMARVHRALDGGRVDILAHPSGRLIEEREPGDFDWPEMFQIAKRNGVVLEINADPARLDLNAEHVREALDAGNLIVINCDAHRPDGFATLAYGVGVARRAFTPRHRIINSWDIGKLEAWMKDRHS